MSVFGVAPIRTQSVRSAHRSSVRVGDISAASDRNPTEPVSRHAADLRAIVTTAAPIESAA